MAGEQPKTMDAKVRMLKERIDLFEKQLMDIGNSVALLARREAKTRDVGDTLASQMMTFAEADKLLPTFKRGLYIFADYFAAVQDYRNALVERLEAKIIQEVALYEDFCKRAREEVNSYSSNWRNFGRRSAANVQKLEGNQSKDTGIEEVAGMPGILGYMDKFEQKKLSDLKRMFAEMAQIELIFHCKAVEMLSDGFKGLVSIDEQNDIQEFRKFYATNEAQGGTTTSQTENIRSQSLPPIKKSPSQPELDNQKQPEMQSSSLLRRFNSTPSVLSEDRNKGGSKKVEDKDEDEDESEEDEEGGSEDEEESDESDPAHNGPSSSSGAKSLNRPSSAKRS